MQTRRHFIRNIALAGAGAGLLRRSFGQEALPAPAQNGVSFFLVGDTHYRAAVNDISQMDGISSGYNGRLVDWLNNLPGTPLPAAIGGGTVPQPHGVIHGGDIVDNGD